MPRTATVDAIVVGAGAAGLAATGELSHAGLSVILLEARGRIGGRIYTIHDADASLPMELGAEFIHGEPEETFAITRGASLAVAELPDEHYWSRDGRLSKLPDYWERITRARKAVRRFLKRTSRRDVSVSDFLTSAASRDPDRELFQEFVEGYHAAYPERLSALWVAGDPDKEAESGSEQFRIVRGYDALTHALRTSLDPRRVEVRLGTAVTDIEWSRGSVSVHCHNSVGARVGPFHGRTAVITLPAPVLRSGTVEFKPEIAEKSRALRHLEAGQVFKMVLQFREAFWNDDNFVKERLRSAKEEPAAVNFLHASRSPVPTWWTTSPARTTRLTAWAAGPRADALLNQDPATQVNQVLDALADAFAVPRATIDDQFESSAIHDWRADPFSKGAYTYVGVGGSASQGALAKPVAGTLFFAGEATDAEQTGTVAGAIASGRRAAKQLRRTLKA